MAIKPFEIQGSTLTIGGVDLEAGTTGIVIPGVTQATNYTVDEVNDTDDQTQQFNPAKVVAVDAITYALIAAGSNPTTTADFTVELDDDNYIDEIIVNGRGTYTAQQATTNASTDMYAYRGTSSASDRPIVPEDWTQIPFRPKMRAGEVETIGGGTGGGVVDRTVNYPFGEAGDTQGTLANDNGTLYFCYQDFVGTETVITAINSSDGSGTGQQYDDATFDLSDSDNSDISDFVAANWNLIQNGNGMSTEVSVDGGDTWFSSVGTSYYPSNTPPTFSVSYNQVNQPQPGDEVEVRFIGLEQEIWLDISNGGITVTSDDQTFNGITQISFPGATISSGPPWIASIVYPSSETVTPRTYVLSDEAGTFDPITSPVEAYIDGMDYNGGEAIADGAFGPGSSRVALYADSMFAMIATNSSANTVYYNGDSGADGEGQKVKTNVLVNNYRGYYASSNLLSGAGDAAISQIVISKSDAHSSGYMIDSQDTGVDDFYVGNVGEGTVIMLNVYWAADGGPYNSSVQLAVQEFIDNVIFDGSAERTDINLMKTAFYANSAAMRTTIENDEGDYLFEDFEFFGGTQVVRPTSNSGVDALLEIGTTSSNYGSTSIVNGGSGYAEDDILTVSGTEFGGTSPANDVTITVQSVDINGAITGFNAQGTVPTQVWPQSYIVDGGEDQYDTSNFIGTNFTRGSATVTIDTNNGGDNDNATLTVVTSTVDITPGQWIWVPSQSNGSYILWAKSYAFNNTASYFSEYSGGTSTLVLDTDFEVDVQDDIRLTAKDVFGLRNYSTTESINIKTQYDNGPDENTWRFLADGGLEFPDGTIQTTAYTGQSSGGGVASALYVTANVDGNITTSTDGTTWTASFNTGLSFIGSVAVGPEKIIFTGQDVNPEDGTPVPGLFATSAPTVQATLIAGTDNTGGPDYYWNKVKYFAGTTYPWVAVGYYDGAYKYPILAYSADGVTWIFSDVINDNNAYSTTNLEFTDIAYGAGTYLISARGDSVAGGMWPTTDLTTSMSTSMGPIPSVEDNFKAVEYFGAQVFSIARWIGFTTSAGSWYTGNSDPTVLGDWNTWGPGEIAADIETATNLPDVSIEEFTSGQLNTGDWVWMASSGAGHIVWWPNAPVGPFVSIPSPYTATITNISSAANAQITFTGNSQSLSGEKITITGVTPSDFNGTYYYNSTEGSLYTDTGLTTPFDSSALTYVSGGTITWSHGQYIDSLGFAAGKFYCANDSEEIFEGVFTEGEGLQLTWTKVNDQSNLGLEYWNAFAYYEEFTSGTSNVLVNGEQTFTLNTDGTITFPDNTVQTTAYTGELVGKGYASGTGFKRTIHTNASGYQGGESASLLIKNSDAVDIAAGDSITFRNGEIRTITEIENIGDATWLYWDLGVPGGEFDPRYPVTVTSDDYVAETKLTARIKPDLSTEGSGQYMDVYVGGSAVLENKHVHMAGHDADTEIFLGTDNNFVSAKEAGLSPARVNLKSENDITVSDTNLRMSRNSTWVSIYGDGENRNNHDNTYDLTWNVIESDDQGNFYVGGESCSWAEAMIAKYGPDGDLVWKKLVNGDDTSGWQVDGVAYNPVDKEVAVAVQTNINRDYNYYKVSVHNSETGEYKSTFDIYDTDGYINAHAMTWHPTLGYVLVGETHGEFTSTGVINSVVEDYNLTTLESTGNELFVTNGGALPSVLPQAGDTFNYNGGTSTVSSVNTYSTYYGLVLLGTTVGDPGGNPVVLHHSLSTTGIIELPRNSVKIGGSFPGISQGWLLSGTNITGTQEIQAGAGLYQNVAVTATSGSGSGMTVSIRVDYAGNYYENFASYTTGANYNNGDAFKIVGSLLGGIDGGTNVTGTVQSTEASGDNAVAYFTKVDHPDMYNQLNACAWTVSFNTNTYNVISCTDNGSRWAVILQNCTDLTPTSMLFYTAAGNDLTGTVNDNSSIDNVGLTGTPNPLANYRLDMGYTMGYGSTNFAGGTFTISTALNNRAFVWTNGWNKIYGPEGSTDQSYGYCVAVDTYSGGLVVGGKDAGENTGFIWKLSSTGTTAWVRGFDDDTDDVTSVAVSRVNGSIYATTNYQSVNKFTSEGTLLKRVHPDDMWWGFDTPQLKLEQGLDGIEYVYVGGRFGAAWVNNSGFFVSKLNAELENIWSRNMWNGDSEINVHYDQLHNSFALGRGNVVLVGNTYVMSDNNYNGILASISTADDINTYNLRNWNVENAGNNARYLVDTGISEVNLITSGSTTASGTLAYEAYTSNLTWNNWAWKSVTINLDETTSGSIVGVGKIEFANGGTLDHNPSDIPPAYTDFAQDGWYYTLELSDRGRFIKNQEIPNDTSVQDLYITVPSNNNVSFPVGSVITLINTSSDSAGGYRIYVQPENYSNSDCPRIWATGGNQNYSTWSFQGIQTATLMKIGSNEWLLTCNNVTNED